MPSWRRVLPLLLVLVLAGAVFASGAYRYLSFEAVESAGEGLRHAVSARWLLSLLVLMAVFTVLTASVTPGVFFVTILAGFLFGPWVGGVATSIAATAGALVVYWAGSSVARDSLRRRAEAGNGLLGRICAQIDQDTFAYVLAARLVVSVPFHLINVAAGVMQVRVVPYALATFLGILPAHLIYCWIGARLDQIDGQDDIAGIMSRFAWPLAGVAFLSLGLPILLRMIRRWRAAIPPR
jgi:uncharacterized membrane protein YdjX (TVP38/TMEM64 family)